jgi:type II secretory pathway pseudopilin PulG
MKTWRAIRDERGIILSETLVAALISTLVIGAGVTFFVVALGSSPRAAERSAAVQQGRVALERITRELRQGYHIASEDPSRLVILTFVKRSSCGADTDGPAIRCQVTYNCQDGACTRTERDPWGAGSAPPRQVVSGLASDSVFAVERDPAGIEPPFIAVRLEYPASDGDGEALTLDDGVVLRNPPLGGPTGA